MTDHYVGSRLVVGIPIPLYRRLWDWLLRRKPAVQVRTITSYDRATSTITVDQDFTVGTGEEFRILK